MKRTALPVKAARSSGFSVFIKRFSKDKIAVISLILFLIILLACICAPLLTGDLYESINKRETLLPPSREHILGTDRLGRDLFSRILYGGRKSFSVTFTAVAVSLIGLIPGLLAGYYGGKADAVLSRANDALASIPSFLLVVFAECLLGWGEGNYKYAIGLALMPSLMKLTRSLVQNIISNEYIEASRALGVSDGKIICSHVLRNILPSLIVYIFNSAADALLLCTVMGYLGIGVNPPTPEWGSLVHDGYVVIIAHPLLVVFSCIPIVISILALNMIGKAARDAFSGNLEET